MVAHLQQTLNSLRSEDAETRRTGLRAIRNQVIGSKSKKLQYLHAGVMPLVLELLACDADASVLVHSANTLGSLTCGITEGVEQLLCGSGQLAPLLRTLLSTHAPVVAAGVRALKLVMQSPLVPHGALLQPGVLSCLVRLLGAADPQLGEAVACVLARCCHDAHEAQVLTVAGAVHGLLPLLLSERGASQVCALAGLAPLLSQGVLAIQVVLTAGGTRGRDQALDALLCLVKHDAALTRFQAACCLAHLARGGDPHSAAYHCRPAGAAAPPPASAALEGGTSSAEAACASSGLSDAQAASARRAALPVLLRLLAGSDPLRLQVPPVLARLIEDSEELQKTAAEADAIRVLAGFVAAWTPAGSSSAPTTAASAGSSAGGAAAAAACTAANVRGAAGGGTSGTEAACSSRGQGILVDSGLRAGTLRALGCICMNRDASRKQLIDAKVMPHIVRALEDSSGGTRAAAAMCVLALSRSVRHLRGNLLTAEIAVQLCKLLDDPNTDVQVVASAAVCNLVPEFSSMRDVVLCNGGLRRLVQLSASPLRALRLHCAWALRNLTFKSDTAVCSALIQELPWSHMQSLLGDVDAGVQEQAVCMLRNVCGDGPQHVDAAMKWAAAGGGAGLLGILKEKLQPGRATPPAVVLHAMYACANLLTGGEEHQAAFMSLGIPALLAHHLAAPSRVDRGGTVAAAAAPPVSAAGSDVRTAAVWVIINLTGPDSGPGRASRQAALRDLGLHTTLQALAEHEGVALDLRERVHTALEQLR